MALVNKGATILVKDIESREKLINELDLLIKDEEKQNQLSENIIKLGVKDADKRILGIIEEMLGF